MLHLVFQSTPDLSIFDRMASGDVTVFLESGVLGTIQNSRLSETLKAKLGDIRFCVLSEDMTIRGILETELTTGFEVIDYAGLVQLTVENPLIQSWC
jgi:tRNA 2-thiouridine synthesizing protein B